MKKYLVLITILQSLSSFIFPKDVSPVLSIRYDNLSSTVAVSDAIGLKMDLGDNKFTGFDTDGKDYRIYMGWGFGKVGFGHDGTDAPGPGNEYTVGATYEVLDNINMDLDYVMGTTEDLRLSLNIHF